MNELMNKIKICDSEQTDIHTVLPSNPTVATITAQH